MTSLAKLVKDLAEPSNYHDRNFIGSDEDYNERIARSTTLYIGNLSFYTTEEQLYEYFANFGPVKRVIMGLDKERKTPCGFAFVEYFLRSHAVNCKRLFSGLKLDDRFIRVDWDYGFEEGRQYGRGKSGGQVRDEYRATYDAGRGGWGKQADEIGTGGRDAKRQRGSRYCDDGDRQNEHLNQSESIKHDGHFRRERNEDE